MDQFGNAVDFLRPLVAGVMGYPVRHSLSPDIFEFLSRRLEIPVVYRRWEVKPEELKSTVKVLKTLGNFSGWNATSPHKEALFQEMDAVSPECEKLRSVNVVQIVENRLIGHNTDIIGIQRTLEEVEFKCSGSKVILFGAGGAAVSVAYVLGKQGASQIQIVNRTLTRAEDLASRMRLLFAETEFLATEWNEQDIFSADLYVNATSLRGKWTTLKLDQKGLLFDLLYPVFPCPKTEFEMQGERLKMPAVNGLDMLVWQALAAFEIWTEICVDSTLKQELKNHLIGLIYES